jgi:hypothetical protein
VRNGIAVKRAEAVAAEHGRDPFVIARSLGYRVSYDPLPKGIEEMVLPDLRMLWLHPDCRRDPHRARRLVAHALGHHFLHVGNQVSHGPLPKAFFHKHELQAEAFAAALIYGTRAGEAVGT